MNTTLVPRHRLASIVAVALSAVGLQVAASDSPPPGTMAAVLAASTAADWRPLDPEKTLYLDLDSGRVIFELAPNFAPAHVANLRTLTQAGWFDGLSINRVQDNFVTQWGDPESSKPLGAAKSKIAPEFEQSWNRSWRMTRLPDGDVYASQVGFIEGFAAALDERAGKVWLTHCYGTLGVGRDTPSDSGNAAELYAVIGHAPRQLDRNITVIGRAVRGMELLAALPRGTLPLGFYAKPEERVPIKRMRFAMDLPPAERIPMEVLRTDTPTFAALVESRRNRRDEWYLQPAGKIDLCSVPIPVRERR
jgi:peptidylprolyl isomerase